MLCRKSRALLRCQPPYIYFQEIRKWNQRFPADVRHEIIQGDAAALLFEPLAGGADDVIRPDSLLDFDDNFVRR